MKKSIAEAMDFLAGAEGLGLGSTTQKPRLMRTFATRLGHRGSDAPPARHSLPLPSNPSFAIPANKKGTRASAKLAIKLKLATTIFVVAF